MKNILDPFLLESINEELKIISNFFSIGKDSFVDFYILIENRLYEIDDIHIKELTCFNSFDQESYNLNDIKNEIAKYFKINKENIIISSYLENSFFIIIYKNTNDYNVLKFINKIVSSILVKYIYEDKVNKLNSEIKSLKESLYLREKEINTIYKLEKLFLENNDIENSIKKILEIAINVLNSDSGSISIIDGNNLKFYMISENSPELLINKVISKNSGIIGKAIEDKKTIIVNDVEKSKLWARDFATKINYIPKAIIATPIFLPDKKVIGGIEIVHKNETAKFSKSDEVLLTIFSNQIGRFLYYRNFK